MRAKFKKLFPNNQFARAVSVLAGGTAGAQLIIVVASPILTRLYNPEDFGLLAVYAAILAILSVVASLRYQLAIPVPESEVEAASIVCLSLLVVCCTTLFSLLALWLFGTQLVNLLNTPDLYNYLWLIPAGLFLVGIYQVLEYWAIRQKAFGNIAGTKLTQSTGMVIIQVTGHALGPIALLVGRVVGQSLGVFRLGKLACTKNRVSFSAVNKEAMTNVAKRYKSFPLISTWSGLTSSVGKNIPPLLIAAFLGANAAGLFSLALRVLSQPMTVIGKAVSDAFYQRAAEANRLGSLGEAVESVYSTLVKVAIAPALVAFLIIPETFLIVFGDAWYAAGEVAQWMIPWLFFQFVVSPCTGIYPIIDRHDIALRFQISLLIASLVGSVVGGFYFGDLVWTVLIISILSSFVYLWRAVVTFHVVGLHWLAPAFSLFKSIPLSLVVNFPVIFAFAVLESHIAWLFLSAAFSGFLWLLLILMPEVKKSHYAG